MHTINVETKLERATRMIIQAHTRVDSAILTSIRAYDALCDAPDNAPGQAHRMRQSVQGNIVEHFGISAHGARFVWDSVLEHLAEVRETDTPSQSTLAIRLDEIIDAVRDGVADADIREMRRLLLDIFVDSSDSQ